MPIILKVMELNEGLIIKNIIDIGNKKFVYQNSNNHLYLYQN
jgi:hypothetical protein